MSEVNPTNSMNSRDSINSTDPTNPTNSINSINPMGSIDPDDSRLWYVIHTKPGGEDRVRTNLHNQEIETFLPLLETYQYCGGRIVQRIKPLFPNYLFAKLDLTHHYYKVKWTRGVSKILGSGDGPVPICEKVIQTIKERSGRDNIVKLEDGLKDGDVIQVTSGPLRNLKGIFQKIMSGKGRVRILLSLIGVDVPVQISRWQIKKVA